VLKERLLRILLVVLKQTKTNEGMINPGYQELTKEVMVPKMLRRIAFSTVSIQMEWALTLN
jgi:hypothetical protein